MPQPPAALRWIAARLLPAAHRDLLLVSSVLLGLTALDPVSFVAAIVLLALVAAVAAIVPARRAASVDPLIALRTL